MSSEQRRKFKEDFLDLQKSSLAGANTRFHDIIKTHEDIKESKKTTTALKKDWTTNEKSNLRKIQTDALEQLPKQIEEGKVEKFRKGGRVKGIKNTPTTIIAHAGEVIIPNSLPELQKHVIKIINAYNKSHK